MRFKRKPEKFLHTIIGEPENELFTASRQYSGLGLKRGAVLRQTIPLKQLVPISRQTIFLTFVLSCALFFCPVNEALSQTPTSSLRIGQYGNAWIETAAEKKVPMDFIILQVPHTRPVAETAGRFKSLSDLGISILADVLFYEDRDQRSGARNAKPLKGHGHYVTTFSKAVDGLQSLRIEGFTIEEENVYWGGRARFLEDLYRDLKSRYPGQKFFQWYSTGLKPNVPGRDSPDLPADGWIFDAYRLDGKAYVDLIEGTLSRGKPVYSVIWASPNWRPGDKSKTPDLNWWNSEGWKVFAWQLAVNKKNNVPTAFYMYWLESGGKERKILPLSKANDENAISFINDFVKKTVPFLKSTEAFPLKELKNPPSWVPMFSHR